MIRLQLESSGEASVVKALHATEALTHGPLQRIECTRARREHEPDTHNTLISKHKPISDRAKEHKLKNVYPFSPIHSFLSGPPTLPTPPPPRLRRGVVKDAHGRCFNRSPPFTPNLPSHTLLVKKSHLCSSPPYPPSVCEGVGL